MKLKIASSLIHGKGVIAKTPIDEGKFIATTYFHNTEGLLEPTQVMRFINHDRDGNVSLEEVNGEFLFRANRSIAIDEELTLDYSTLHKHGSTDAWYLARLLDYLLNEKGMKEAFENHLDKEGM